MNFGMAKGNRVVRAIRSDVWKGLVRRNKKSLSMEKEGAERKMLPMSLSRFNFLMSAGDRRGDSRTLMLFRMTRRHERTIT